MENVGYMCFDEYKLCKFGADDEKLNRLSHSIASIPVSFYTHSSPKNIHLLCVDQAHSAQAE